MSRTILLADDSVTIQKVVELTFMDEDYTVVAVSRGDEALTALNDVNPDLVITDLHMPGANGFEVCRQAKAQGLPVLLLVGTFEPFQDDEAKEAGVDGVVKKPFDSQELLQRVEELMASSSGTDSEAGASEEMVVEASPWDDANQLESAEIEVAEGLISTDTTHASDDTPLAAANSDDLPGLDELPPLDAVDEPGDSSSTDPFESESVPTFDDEAPTQTMASVSLDEVEAVESVGSANGSSGSPAGPLSTEDIDRVARRVIELLGDNLLRDVAWEVVPDLAEVVIKDRIRELERQLK